MPQFKIPEGKLVYGYSRECHSHGEGVRVIQISETQLELEYLNEGKDSHQTGNSRRAQIGILGQVNWGDSYLGDSIRYQVQIPSPGTFFGPGRLERSKGIMAIRGNTGCSSYAETDQNCRKAPSGRSHSHHSR